MNVAVLGTGSVGRTVAGTIGSLGHEVRIGTRDVEALMARTDDAPTFAEWITTVTSVQAMTFKDAATFGEIVFNATSGTASLEALRAAGAANLAGKVIVDIANPLDFSKGFPPTLSVCNETSLAEQIQAAFPDARVVKTLNTVNASVMVDPVSVGGGEHDMFMAGDDDDAKRTVESILRDWFGWTRVTDLGDITNARGMEMYLPLWVRLYGAAGTGAFNIAIVR
ncbi:MAG TPA: NAD(P)-binding domain-containing protein [Actinomycetota bacterium]|nr:NAD(P)-binding domain-containing protein [Actinomycetota bacterium]